MSIQGNINQTIALVGALASQSPELKQQAEARASVRLETKNFEKLQNAIKQIESEYPTASTQDKRQLTKLKKELSKESVGSLSELRGIALKSGDVEGIKKYDELIRQNKPQRPKAKAKVKVAQSSLEDEQMLKKAQQKALKDAVAEIRSKNLRADIAAKQDIKRTKEGSFNG